MKFITSASILLRASQLFLTSSASNPPAATTPAPESSSPPVGRVVTLLTELKQRLNTDNTNEQAVFDKYACWCEETTSRKAQAIEANRAEIGRLGQEILTQKALVAEKTLEVQQTMAEIQANEKAQQQATSIRQKENAAYAAEVAELQQAVNALERAVHVLRDATAPPPTAPALVQQQQREGVIGAAALQQAAAALADAQAALAVVPERMLARHAGTASKLQLLSSHAASLATVSSQRAKYTPQSGTVQGILGDLYDTFTKDLEGQHGDEARKSTAYENLIATKKQEVNLLQEKIQKAEKVKVEAETMLAEALQSYSDTEAQLKDDVAFFDATKSACESKTNAWATRKGLRTEQLAGIAQALTILTSDEAKTLFSTAITPGVGMFLQLSSSPSRAGQAQQAAQALRRQGVKAHSLRLIAVAAELQFTQGGHFDEAIVAIDTMVGVLKQEAATDLTQRDECVKNLHNIESNISEINWKVEVNDAELTKIGESITELEGMETQVTLDIQLVAQQILDLTSNRTQENSDFKAAKADDLKAIGLLQQAKAALASYYANHSIELGPTESGRAAALLQNGTAPNRSDVLYTKDDAPDAEFSHKSKGKQETKGVVAILETIIEDLSTEVANAVKAEEETQLEYEAQKKAAEKLEGSLVAKKVNIVSDLAQRRTDKTNEETDKSNNEGDLGTQTGLKASTEPPCTQIANQFEDRNTKRQLELDGLRQAKEFLAGYQVSKGDGSTAPGAAAAALQQEKVAPAHLRGLVAPARGQAVRRHA